MKEDHVLCDKCGMQPKLHHSTHNMVRYSKTSPKREAMLSMEQQFSKLHKTVEGRLAETDDALKKVQGQLEKIEELSPRATDTDILKRTLAKGG